MGRRQREMSEDARWTHRSDTVVRAFDGPPPDRTYAPRWDVTRRCMTRCTAWAYAVTEPRLVLSQSMTKTLRVWDVVSGECLRTLRGTHGVRSRPWRSRPTGIRPSRPVRSKTLRVWDVASGECLRTLQGHTSAVDGRGAHARREDGRLRQLRTARSACGTSTAGNASGPSTGHTCWVDAVALTPDGHTAVSASVRDKPSACGTSPAGNASRTLDRTHGTVNAVALTPDGNTAVSASE